MLLKQAYARHMDKTSGSNQSLRSLFQQSAIEESVTRAEVLFANYRYVKEKRGFTIMQVRQGL